MRPLLLLFSAVVAVFGSAIPARAARPDPADYPLRLQIFQFVARSRHQGEGKNLAPDNLDYFNGAGHADLYENGQPRGLDFSFSCADPLHASSGFETFPARWKKPERTLEVLIPERGKPWNYLPCQIQVALRPGLAYFWNDDKIAEESSALLKAWMLKHHFDPENGQDEPLDADPAPVAGDGSGSSSSRENPPR